MFEVNIERVDDLLCDSGVDQHDDIARVEVLKCAYMNLGRVKFFKNQGMTIWDRLIYYLQITFTDSLLT